MKSISLPLRVVAMFVLVLAVVVAAGAFLSTTSIQAQPLAMDEILLTEIAVTPTEGEFIEIYNPGDVAVDLSDAYLTDATYANGDAFYYNIVTGENAGGGSFSDFHARFPDGASIGPGEYQTVSLAGSTAFAGIFGMDPTYELFEDDAEPDAVPDMREALPGSINNQGGLSNSGEVVILYYWDGAHDLVQDLDYAVWGDKAEAVDKTGVAIDGPDEGEETTEFLPDTAIDNQDVIAPGGHDSDEAWQREDMDEGAEIAEGGNGVTGNDETSEDLSNTWCAGPPTPGAVTDCSDPLPPTLELKINEIQGAAQFSPYQDEVAGNVPGIVTAVRSFGFYMQDPEPDADIATSEGILVITSDEVAIGDSVVITGTITEYYGGGADSGEMPITELVDASATILSSGNPLPEPSIIGQGGRIPPSEVIDSDPNTFDPVNDGIDFYESMEGMYVQVNNAVAVGPTSRYGEIPVVADGGADAGVRSPHGGVVIQKHDFNPERIHIDDAIIKSEPKVNVGDMFDGAIVGVMDYAYGNFKLYNVEPLPDVISAGFEPEMTEAATVEELSVATFNTLNLDPGDDAEKFANVANVIVVNMASPDIIALQEIQDNTGPDDDGVTSADVTLTMLIDAIVAAGGPSYEFLEIAPADKQDGGQPGANIQVAYLYRPDRVIFAARPGADAVTAVGVVPTNTGPELTLNPGRVDPANPAFAENPDTGFEGTRKSIATEFIFEGNRVFLINNHFKSKSGDGALFGVQPPVFKTEVQRTAQAQVINDFVDSILALDANANVIVLGDLNEFEFNPPLDALKGDALTNLIETMPVAERYSYIYQGNSEVLDHILVSENLLGYHNPVVDIVHANVVFFDYDPASDHDPVVAKFSFPAGDYELPQQEATRFRGYTLKQTADGATSPAADLTINLYGRNQGEPEPGNFIMTQISQASGFFNFYILPEPKYTFDFYRLVVDAPEGQVPAGAWSEDGFVISGTEILWFQPNEPWWNTVHENTFYFKDPVAFWLTVLHTNDTHAHLESFTPWGSVLQGGVARRYTAIQDVKAEGGNVMLVDAGDAFQGTLFFNYWQGGEEAYFMNALGYEAMAVGNHEFDSGPATLADFIGLADFPVLSANTDASADPDLAGMILPYIILEVGGEQIGVMGLTTEKTSSISSPGDNVIFNDVVTSAQATVTELEGMGINKIVSLDHLGYDADQDLAAAVDGIDVIVCGHSHTLLGDMEGAEGPYPTEIVSPSGAPVLIISAQEWGSYLGRLDVGFTADGIVDSFGGAPIFIDESIPEDTTIAADVATFAEPFEELKNTIIGQSAINLEGTRELVRSQETNLGDLICDAVLWQTAAEGTQICMQNGGGIRSSIPAGDVTMGQVLEVLPFGNQISTFGLLGSDVWVALENGVSDWPGGGRFSQVAGLRFTFDPTLEVGSRIISVEVLNAEGGYDALDPNAVYKLASNNFMRGGGDGYDVFRDNAIDPYDSGAVLADALAEYIGEISPVEEADILGGRITQVPAN